MENFFKTTWDKGRKEGLTRGITGSIQLLSRAGYSSDSIREQIRDQYGFTDEEARDYMEQSKKEN